MSDRSDEVTESRDTDDLLEETESLLSGSDLEADSGAGTASTPEDRPEAGGDVGAIDDSLGSGTLQSSDEPEPSTTAPAESSDSRLGRLGDRLTPGRSPADYFSPRAFLALVLLVGAGLIGGRMLIPLAGRMLGMLGVAFAVGLLTSKRRYLEMGAAGAAVGGVSAVLSNAVFAIAGSTQAVLAVGVTIGLVACLLGYYFGRDLRNGLTQDIE